MLDEHTTPGKEFMSVLPALAIFAETKAQQDYLASVVLAGGFMVVQDGIAADIGLAVVGANLPQGKNSLPTLTLGVDMALPVRASQVIEALHRLARRQAAPPAQLRIGPHSLDTRENIFLPQDGEAIRLTEKETAILACLKQSEGKSVTREELLTRVWSYADGVETHTLETHIYRLRQKIEKDPSNPDILLTEEDGYRLPE